MDNNSILYICAPHNSHIQQLYVAKSPGAGEGLTKNKKKGPAALRQQTGRPFDYNTHKWRGGAGVVLPVCGWPGPCGCSALVCGRWSLCGWPGPWCVADGMVSLARFVCGAVGGGRVAGCPRVARGPCVGRVSFVSRGPCGVGRVRVWQARSTCGWPGRRVGCGPRVARGPCLAGLARLCLWWAVLGWWSSVAGWPCVAGHLWPASQVWPVDHIV